MPYGSRGIELAVLWWSVQPVAGMAMVSSCGDQPGTWTTDEGPIGKAEAVIWFRWCNQASILELGDSGLDPAAM